MKDVLIDALLDSLKILPFLLIMYILIEIVEDKTLHLFKKNEANYHNYGPVIGAGFGLIPQCGFGVVATHLFAKKMISIGTLAAIYVATSDEAIPIMLAHPESFKKIIPLLLTKFFFAVFVGYLFDSFIQKKHLKQINLEEKENSIGCCGHHIEKEKKEGKFKKYGIHPFIHSLKIFVFIFIVNMMIGSCIYWIKEEKMIAFLNQTKYWQPLFCVLIGLIPNCASSVLISQLFVTSSLSFGACIAGLCVNSGIAYTILFKENKNQKENVFLILGIVCLSLLLGYLLTFLLPV